MAMGEVTAERVRLSSSEYNAAVLRFESSPAFIPEASSWRRRPLAPQRNRSSAFWEAFEDRAVFYDCFWSDGNGSVLLVGPPPLNLQPMFDTLIFTAGGKLLTPTHYPSRSTHIIELHGVPDDAAYVEAASSGLDLSLPIRPNASSHFTGRNLVVTMNKDNDLVWVKDWALWHAKVHKADAFLVFDNGSSRYSNTQLAEALSSVDGVKIVAVLDWPHRYGRKDPAIFNRPHYPHFLQVSSLNVALRRFGSRAAGLLNCDIDELTGTNGRGSAFEQVAASPQGLIMLKGRWVEPYDTDKSPLAHLRNRYTSRNPFRSICASKWILDPSQDWISSPAAKPSVHRIYDVPKSIGRNAPTLPFWHFRAIGTNWKENRSQPRQGSRWAYRRLVDLDAEVAEHFS